MHMARGDKKGKESKKPKQVGGKSGPKSAYQLRNESGTTTALKIRGK
jgi:hypothetical protein